MKSSKIVRLEYEIALKKEKLSDIRYNFYINGSNVDIDEFERTSIDIYWLEQELLQKRFGSSKMATPFNWAKIIKVARYKYPKLLDRTDLGVFCYIKWDYDKFLECLDEYHLLISQGILK